MASQTRQVRSRPLTPGLEQLGSLTPAPTPLRPDGLLTGLEEEGEAEADLAAEAEIAQEFPPQTRRTGSAMNIECYLAGRRRRRRRRVRRGV